MTKKLRHKKYRVSKFLLKKEKRILRNRKRHILRFKERQRTIFTKFFRRLLKKPIKNAELLKYPFIVKYLYQLKLWKKPELRSWRYFFTKRHKYFNVATPTRRKWLHFKFLFKRRFFWYKNLTKRQNITFRKLYLLQLKGSSKHNYIRLKHKFKVVYNEQRKFNNWIVWIVKCMRAKRYSSLLSFYISLFFHKNNKNILNSLINMGDFDVLKFFSNLSTCITNFVTFRAYLYKLRKYSYLYTSIYKHASYFYVRSKWVDRIKKRKNFFYATAKARRRSKFFFRLKRTIILMFDLNKMKKQFFYIKIKTVDTNMFLTLTDYRHKVIIYRSTGHVSENRKRKTKLSPFTISKMTFEIVKKIKNLKIQYMIVNINTRMNKNIRSIFRSISSAVRVKIVQAHYSKPIPHHFGTKKPRPKRL